MRIEASVWPSRRRVKTTVIPSPERLQETQLGALGVPSEGLIYWYITTNVYKRDDSYDRVVHTDRSTNASSWLTLRHTLRHRSSSRVILRHHWHHYASTTGLAPLLRIRRPRGVPTIQPVSLTLLWPLTVSHWCRPLTYWPSMMTNWTMTALNVDRLPFDQYVL